MSSDQEAAAELCGREGNRGSGVALITCPGICVVYIDLWAQPPNTRSIISPNS